MSEAAGMTERVAVERRGAKAPAVSVGLPVCNGENFLARAIDSILAQDFGDFELIISDNASTDRTARICEEYARTDARVRYHRHDTNIGAAPNHNFVFEQARSRYFKWAAHDDECHPEFLRRCVEVLERRPEVVLAYPEAELIDCTGNVTGRYTASIASADRRPHVRVAHLLETIGLGTPMYGLIRSDTLRRTGLHGSYISADLVLLAEVAILGVIHQVREPLLRKRLHPGRSQEAHRTEAELLAWFNPLDVRSRGLLPPEYHLTLKYLRGVWALPVRPATKVSCSWEVLRVRHRGIRLRRRIRSLFSRPATDGADVRAGTAETHLTETGHPLGDHPQR